MTEHTEHTAVDLRRIARAALRSLGQWPPDDVDDLVSEIVLRHLEHAASGGRSSRQRWRWYATGAVRSLYGDRRYRGRYGREVLMAEPPEPHIVGDELAALALVRLRGTWPRLTEIQQAGLRTALGMNSVHAEARRLGTSARVICQGRIVALRRLDRPHDYSRDARRG